MSTPTSETYTELQNAYVHFNLELFAGELPPCLITLQRRKKTMGYLSPDRFVNRAGRRTDEIAMNPAYFAVCSLEDILSTLVHEMTHLWQWRFGKPGRMRYHNKEWANKMESIGLMPSTTGEPGGKKTGDRMDHYIITEGAFQASAHRLITDEFQISWLDRFPETLFVGTQTDLPIKDMDLLALGVEEPDTVQPVAKRSKVKFTCPGCGANAWGKPTLKLVCGTCDEALIARD